MNFLTKMPRNVSAALAGATSGRVDWYSWRLGVASFFIPFLFIVRPKIFLEGSIAEIGFALLAAAICVLSISYAIARQFRIHWSLRASLLAASSVVLVPGESTLVIGTVLSALLLVLLLWWANPWLRDLFSKTNSPSDWPH